VGLIGKIPEGKLMRIFLLVLCTFALSAKASAFDHSHQLLKQLLGEVVTVNNFQSRVDYGEVESRRNELESYLSQLAGVTQTEFDEFTGDQQLAYLINTYNAYQLKQVIDHYPIKSIKDVGSFFSSPWSKEFFTLFGKPASLDHVEHGLIRTIFDEPRIHFAVNCASISCPPLMPEAFVADRLDTQLETATFNFLMDTDANRLEGDTLYVSKIFDWYEADFPQGVVEFVGKYRPEWVENGKPDLGYTNYDWNLNTVNPAQGDDEFF
jgi:hypothetical protein